MARKTIPIDELPNSFDAGADNHRSDTTDGVSSGGAGDPGTPADTINGFESFNPVDGNPDGGTRTRRGRKPGSKNRANGDSPKAKGNLEGLEMLLLSVHFMGAVILSTPELQLAETEANTLARALSNVAAQYNQDMNPRTLAWVNLAMVSAGFYGARAIAIRNRWAEEKAAKAAQQPQRPNNVTDFPAPGAAPKQPNQNAQRPAPAPAPAAGPMDQAMDLYISQPPRAGNED